MAFQRLPMQRIWFPIPWGQNTTFGIAGSTAMNSAAIKVAAIGPVIWGDRTASKNIQSIFWRFGGVIKTGGSTLRVSLQNVSTTTSPGQPTGTVLQSATLTNAQLVASSWFNGIALGAVQNVTLGQMMAVVWEFATFGGSDSVAISVGTDVYNNYESQRFMTSYNGTAWVSLLNSSPGVLFQFDDGTYGGFDNQTPFPFFLNVTGTAVINTGTSPSEVGLRFQLPYPAKIDAISAYMQGGSATGNFNFTIYDGTTALASAPVSGFSYTAYSANKLFVATLGSEVALSANHPYIAALTPTTVNSLTAIYEDFVGFTPLMAAYPGGSNFFYSYRTGAGAWTDMNYRRPKISIGLSAFDDATGSVTSNIFMAGDTY